MKILIISGRETTYPRNQILIDTLRHFGEVDVVTPNVRTRSIIYRSILGSVHAVYGLLTNKYDLIFVGFFGHFITIGLRILSKTPIIFDAFVSAYDTLVYDRKTIKTKSVLARIAFWLDQKSCRSASQILLDTREHIKYFSSTFQISESKFGSIPVSCNESLFFPYGTKPINGTVRVLFYGSFLPLHGIETIVRAAKLLESAPINFRIIGDGMDYKNIRSLALKLRLTNIDFVPPMPLSSLPQEISLSDICLGGHFGTSEKAKRVIPGKTYQFIAMAKPTIVGDNPANHELLTHEYDSWFCKMDDPQALADSIKRLSEDQNLRESLGNNARKTYLIKASSSVLIKLMSDVLNKIRLLN